MPCFLSVPIDGHAVAHRRISTILWYDRLQLALETCQETALDSGDARRANRALMLRLWANDRAEILAERTV